jgi:peptidoglycan/LPS O-acetylase OafA/YrhL
MVDPVNSPTSNRFWTLRYELPFAVFSLLAMLVICVNRKSKRWNMAAAMVVLAVLSGLAACGGKSSSNNPGNTTATLIGTASSGKPASSMPFTVTIE